MSKGIRCSQVITFREVKKKKKFHQSWCKVIFTANGLFNSGRCSPPPPLWMSRFPLSIQRISSNCGHMVLTLCSHGAHMMRQNPEQKAWVRGYVTSLGLIQSGLLSPWTQLIYRYIIKIIWDEQQPSGSENYFNYWSSLR